MVHDNCVGPKGIMCKEGSNFVEVQCPSTVRRRKREFPTMKAIARLPEKERHEKLLAMVKKIKLNSEAFNHEKIKHGQFISQVIFLFA